MARIAIIPEPKKILAGEEGNADPVIREKKTDPDMGQRWSRSGCSAGIPCPA